MFFRCDVSVKDQRHLIFATDNAVSVLPRLIESMYIGCKDFNCYFYLLVIIADIG